MSEFPLLTLLILLPLIGAIFIMTINGDEESVAKNAGYVALYASVFTFALSLFMLFRFNSDDPGFQFVEKAYWLPEWGILYHLGVDGISLFLILLSTFLFPVCILASLRSVKFRVKEYMAAFMLLETMTLGTFCSLDSFLFFLFFEGGMIPMFIIIGIWGGPRRVYSAYKFFLYTLSGSVLMLIGLLALYKETGTGSIPDLLNADIPPGMQYWLFLAFLASFAVKMPMWPVHTWLPDAHVEAPTGGSVILAAVLLKMGGYGFLRFSLPIFPLASQFFAPFMMFLSVVAIIYASLVALAQKDMKKLIAYSSVAHMGFVTLGIFSGTAHGVEGAVFQMLSHGLVSAALFLGVGVLYTRLYSREIDSYGGISANMPRFALVFMVFTLASVGLPGTSGFVGEFLTLLGAYEANVYFSVFAVSGLFLGAAYMLILYRRVFFGEQTNVEAGKMKDMSLDEISYMVVIVLAVLFLGVFPSLVMSRISPSLEVMLSHYQSEVSNKVYTDVGGSNGI